MSIECKRIVAGCAVSWLLAACGGGGSSAPSPAPVTPPSTSTTTTTSGCSVNVASGPFTDVWPGQGWETATPQAQGLCPDALGDAMAYAFATGNDTGAVLIAKNGYLVAERYAADRTAEDFATSWSVAKSFASALLGTALDDGLLEDINEQLLVDFLPDEFAADWRGTDKEQITLQHMMTLRTAMQTVDGGDLYNAADQLAMSLNRPLIGQPGEKLYDYSNADVMIAGEVLQSATGSSAQHYLDSRVGAAIDFQGDWWLDDAGHVMTYCCLDATPRDFLRFGLLLARNGEWRGDRVISEAWIGRSTATALDGDYGYYWWPILPLGRGFAAFGLHSQIVAIWPPDDLVVARFSRYSRVGDGHAVRTSTNYHDTAEPASFDNATFLEHVYEALE